MTDADRSTWEAKILRIVRALSPHEREVLTRFYLLEQTAEQIHREVGITAADLRQLRLRVKKAILASRRAK